MEYIVGECHRNAEGSNIPRLQPYVNLLDKYLGILSINLVDEVFHKFLNRLYDVLIVSMTAVVLAPCSSIEVYHKRTGLREVLDVVTQFVHGDGCGVSPAVAYLKHKK